MSGRLEIRQTKPWFRKQIGSWYVQIGPKQHFLAEGKDSIPIFIVDNSSHFAGQLQAFFYFEIRDDGLIVRE
ncbi:MAG: hypothetical protein JNK93_09635 [Planctomycetia bacterium]|nr:hypothetical protein [Planctomycetia bacterium]